MPTLRYRPEIDGLRAIAVLAVVIFHAKLGLEGGFVGVDVFFVISGFLITSIILRDVDQSKFRALDFWERRVRRIAPAFVVTTLATIVAAWFLYVPSEFERVGRAVIAQTLFASNIFHWRVAGYWGPEAETLPLLHTWSLAVEEQFYIIFPILLVPFAKRARSLVVVGIIIALLASLALCIRFTATKPLFAFYLLPTRAWELLLGVILVHVSGFGHSLPKWLKEITSLLGLAAIGLSVAYFNSRTPFPGVAAILPCLGAAAFIWANGSHLTAAGQVLAWKPFVFVGMVSYSFYLVHWPVIVYSFYWFGENLTWLGKWSLVLVIFLLSVLSWAVVETPIRKKWVLSKRSTLFSTAIASMILLLACGFTITWNRGFPKRFDEQTLQFANAANEFGYRSEVNLDDVKTGKLPTFGAVDSSVKCLVWGDSHAMSLMSAIDAVGKEQGIRVLQVTHSATPPLLNFVHRDGRSLNEKSPEFSQAVVEYAVQNQIDFVVLAAFWTLYEGDPHFEESLRKTIEALDEGGVTVLVVRDVPVHAGVIPRILARARMFGEDTALVGSTLTSHRERNRKVDDLILSCVGSRVQALDPAQYLVDSTGLCRAEIDGVALYGDKDHLTVKGALKLIPMFQAALTEPRQ